MVKPTRYQNDQRIDQLERLFEAASDERYQPMDPDLLAIMDEYAVMKRGMGEQRYCGSPSGPVTIEPVNAAAQVFGPVYTQEQFRSLAISRGLEKRGRSAAEIASLMDDYLEFFAQGGRDEHIGAID
jgi:hypothetical protein